jgi:hypothetical protein
MRPDDLFSVTVTAAEARDANGAKADAIHTLTSAIRVRTLFFMNLLRTSAGELTIIAPQ